MEQLTRDAELPSMLAAALDRVTAYATGAWAEVTGSGDPVTARLEAGPGERSVVARAYVASVREHSPLLFLELLLAGAGWTIGRTRSGAELTAGRAGDELRASYAPTGIVSVTVTSAPLPVSVARARDLIA